MKRIMIAAAAAVLVMGSMTAASAQRGQGRGGFGGPFGQRGGAGLSLLRIPEVQVELKLTDAQIAKAQAKQDEVNNATQEIRQSAGNPRDLSDEDRQKMNAKIQAVTDKALAEVLDENQIKRYKQLVLQREGPMAASRKDVADALKLTEDQRKQIAAIQQGVRQAMMESFQSAGNPRELSDEDRQKLMAKMQENQTKAGEKVLALFTDAQKATWKELTGAPFKFPAFQRPAA